MPEYTHTTREPFYWFVALVSLSMGAGASLFMAVGIRTSGVAAGPVIGLAVGLLMLMAGLVVVWRIGHPVVYRGRATDQCISWHKDGVEQGRFARGEIVRVAIYAMGEDERVEITLKDGSVVRVRWPLAYFGSLSKLYGDLTELGYETFYDGA